MCIRYDACMEFKTRYRVSVKKAGGTVVLASQLAYTDALAAFAHSLQIAQKTELSGTLQLETIIADVMIDRTEAVCLEDGQTVREFIQE